MDNSTTNSTDSISDGYHTFGELYEHRNRLFIALAAWFPRDAWKSLAHHDGTYYENFFIMGINSPVGQITYHLPLELWYDARVTELPAAPEWDGHGSDEVLDRLAELAEL